MRAAVNSLVQSGALGLVAGEPREDVAIVSGPQRRGGGWSVAVCGSGEEREGRGKKAKRMLRGRRCENYITDSKRGIDLPGRLI